MREQARVVVDVQDGRIRAELGTVANLLVTNELDAARGVVACHGLDAHDNDFLIGLVGKELQPLSHLVQTMRKTVQTSEYMASLGPFFVGHAVWQSPIR